MSNIYIQMKKIIFLLVSILTSFNIIASDIVYVGSHTDKVNNLSNDIILYYTDTEIDSIEISMVSIRSKNSVMMIKGLDNIIEFGKALEQTKVRYKIIDENCRKQELYKTYRLDEPIRQGKEIKNDKLSLDKKIKWPKIHFTGTICDKKTEFEPTYFDIDTPPIVLYVSTPNNGNRLYLMSIAVEAYSYYGDTLHSDIIFNCIDDFEKFQQLISIENLLSRIELKKQLLNKNKQ